MDPLEFLLVELHHVGTLQQFTDEFRRVGSRAKVQVVEFRGSSQRAENLMQNVLAWIGRSEERAVVKPSRRALIEKIEIVSREIDGIVRRRPANRELRHSAVPDLYLSGAGGKARSLLQKAGIQIQRRNHFRGLLAGFIRTQRADQGHGMAQPPCVNAEV